MAATVLFEIKKKRRCPSTKKSPFPLVFHLGCDKSSIVTWQFYHGILKPDGVEVTSKEDMKNLYNMGYFGKGTLSRSAPRFYGDGEENDEPRMMSLHRYERHKKLRAEADAGGSPRPAGNADSSNVVLVKLETEEESKESSNDVTVVSATGFDRPVPRILARGKKSLKRARDTSGDSAKDDTAAATSSQRCGDNKTGATDIGAENDDKSSEQTGEKNKTCGVATGDDDEGPDIYECDSSGERILGVEDTVVAAPSAEVEEGADDASDDIIELDSRTGMEVTRTNKDVPLKKENMADDEGGSKLAEKDKVTPEGKACTSAATGSNESGNNDNPAREEPASESVDSGTDVPEEVTVVTDVSEVEELDCKIGVREIDLATKERSDGGQSSGQTRSKRQKRSESDEEETAVDSDVEEVELIREKAAADDSSSGTEPEYFAAEDPWPITESLQLLFEEAYFLSYGLGCLIVKDGDEDLELLKLWRRLCTLCDNFPARYATYHHFRSKGWVVRSGMKYAADYLLYKDGPPFYHASFSVIVRRVHADTLEEEPDHRLQTWQGLSGLIRVNGNASKTVLLCHVIMPKEADLTTPRCLQSFTIQELLVRRWVVSEEREKRDDAS